MSLPIYDTLYRIQIQPLLYSTLKTSCSPVSTIQNHWGLFTSHSPYRRVFWWSSGWSFSRSIIRLFS